MVSPIGSAEDLAKQTEIHYGCVGGGATQAFFKVIFPKLILYISVFWIWIFSKEQQSTNLSTNVVIYEWF